MAKLRINWGELPEGSTVSVFNVVNTAFKDLLVIAPDEKKAMSIAWSANHIHGANEIHEDHYFRAAHKVDPERVKHLQSLLRAVNAAMARRLHGTLHIDDGRLFVGDEEIPE